MKKITTFLALCMLLTTSLTSFSQTSKKESMRPYGSIGTSYTKWNSFNYGFELGCYDSKTWYALTFNKYKSNDTGWVGFKVYRNLKNYSDKVSVFGYAEVSSNIFYKSKSPDVYLNPGFYANFMLNKKVAIGTSLGTSILNNYRNVMTTFPIVTGVSLNYFL